ncbi:MAG: glycosyltransferase [Candidatus Marinimicrobia bacterium]|nr:glycosyltransferase [Candidatus Neomarinimicrobiota bacterium]
MPPLTVIVCAKDEEPHIADCIDSIFSQDYPRDKYSVIAVNDRSEDGTGAILDERAARYGSLRVIHLETCPENVSPKKNAIAQAIKYCKTEFIVATDADAQHREQWLRSCALCYDKLGASTGLSMFKKDTYTSAWERTWQSMQTLENLSHNVVIAGAMVNGFAITANGNNMLYRKELFREQNALKNDVVTGDDSDIIYEAQRRGYDVVFNAHPASVVRLVPEESIPAVINQRIRWASHIMKATLPVIVLGLTVFFFLLRSFLCHYLRFSGLGFSGTGADFCSLRRYVTFHICW